MKRYLKHGGYGMAPFGGDRQWERNCRRCWYLSPAYCKKEPRLPPLSDR